MFYKKLFKNILLKLKFKIRNNEILKAKVMIFVVLVLLLLILLFPDQKNIYQSQNDEVYLNSLNSKNKQILGESENNLNEQSNQILLNNEDRTNINSNSNPNYQEDTYMINLENQNIIDDISLKPCAIVKSTTQEKKVNGSQNSIITLQMTIPLWEWLNTTEVFGKGSSPFMSPSVKAVYESDDMSENRANKFNIYTQLFSHKIKRKINFPILGNGILNTYDNWDNYYYQSQNNYFDTKASSFFNLNPFGINDSSDFEKQQANKIITHLYDDSIQSISEQEIKNLKNLDPNNFMLLNNPLCNEKPNQIDYLYTAKKHLNKNNDNFDAEDEYNSEEYIYNIQERDIDIYNMKIPLLKQALASLYIKELYSQNLDSYSQPQKKIIHNKRCGIELILYQNEYNGDQKLIDELKDTSSQISVLSKEQKKKLNLNSQKKYKIYLPWVCQIREAYKRMSLVYAWAQNNRYKASDDSQIKENYEELLLSLESTYVSEKNQIRNDSKVINQLEKIKKVLLSELKLFDCDELKKQSNELERIVISQLNGVEGAQKIIDKTKEIQKALDNTDCIGNISDRDPLENYLCQDDLLDHKQCYQYDKIGENEIEVYEEDISEKRTYLTFEEQEICKELLETRDNQGDIGEKIKEINERNKNYIEEEKEDQNENVNDLENSQTNNNGLLITPVKGGCVDAISQKMHKDHPGIDCAKAYGNDIQSIADGKVLFAGRVDDSNKPKNMSIWDTDDYCNMGIGGYGYVVYIKHSENLYSLYAHLKKDSIEVSTNQAVFQGQKIGEMGNSGNVSPCPKTSEPYNGTHLHFELRKVIGPIPYFGWKEAHYYDPLCLFNSQGCKIENADVDYTYIQDSSRQNQEAIYTGVTRDLYNRCKLWEKDQKEVQSEEINDLNFPITKSSSVDSQFWSQWDDGLISEKYSHVKQAMDWDRCPSKWIVNNGNTEDDLKLIHLSESMQEYADNKGIVSGTAGFSNINGLISAVSEIVQIPAYKLKTHLHVEYLGVNPANYTSNKVDKLYTGKVDQIMLAKPNICACLGPGQFCPGTSISYFAPNGRSYNKVYDCIDKIGLGDIIQKGEYINPSFVGAGICGMAIKLQADASMVGKIIKDWDENSLWKASERYYGSCEGEVANLYCSATSKSDNELVKKYKQEVNTI